MRPGQQALETALAGAAELQFVQALLVEGQGASGAADLEAQVVLVAVLEPAAADRAPGAIGETQQGVDLVVDGNRAGLQAAGTGRALSMDGAGVGTHGGDIAEQIAGHGQQMAAKVDQGEAGSAMKSSLNSPWKPTISPSSPLWISSRARSIIGLCW